MLKSDLIERIAAETPHLYQRDVDILVNTILDTITAALARGDRVELRDFGVFAVKERESYTARNPRTGGAVSVGEKAIPTFKTGRNMYRRLNPSSDTSVASHPPAHGRTHSQGARLPLEDASLRAQGRTDEPYARPVLT